MEGFISIHYLIVPLISLILVWFVSVVYEVWWKPKRLERYLNRIGIKGTSYKLMYGDLEGDKKLMGQALSKPMPLNHSIVPRVNPAWHQMVQKYGKISLSWHGRRPRLLVADAELMKQIFNNKDGHFQKPPISPLANLLSLGIATMEGGRWKKRRSIIAPSFHHDKILGMLPIFVASCSDMMESWKEKLVDSGGKCEMDVYLQLQQLASDIIARAAFGTTYDEAEIIFGLQKEQMMLVFEATISLYVPGLRFLPTKKNRRRYEIDNKIKATLRDMIRKKERKMLESGKRDDDLLSLLIECQNQSDKEISIDDVIEECKAFYFAGQETTAILLTWTMIVLSMHPEWQEKARSEVLHLFGKTTTPDIKTMNQLKIIPMILQEVMRLYPPVPGLPRYTTKTTQLGDMLIPPGVELTLPMMLIHHDRDYWGEDVEEFKPERFAEGASKAAKVDQMAFMPFSWGPRFCLGQSFSLLEARLVLSMILQRFSFKLSPSYAHAPQTVMTLRPQFGAPLILELI